MKKYAKGDGGDDDALATIVDTTYTQVHSAKIQQ